MLDKKSLSHTSLLLILIVANLFLVSPCLAQTATTESAVATDSNPQDSNLQSVGSEKSQDKASAIAASDAQEDEEEDEEPDCD